MKQKDVLTKNNDLLNVMFRGTPCNRNIFKTSLYIYIFQDEKCRLLRNLSLFMVWNLCLTLDVEKLENVQKKALKQVNGFQETDYLIRVKELGLFTQEERRTYTNLQNHSWNR